eukprot:9910645-Ditylum_brightwellii.AAC.1
MSTPGLSKSKTITFFTNAASMEVTKKTLTKLRKAGIVETENLEEFDKAMWKQVADNLKHSGGWIKNPDKNVDKNSTVPQT